MKKSIVTIIAAAAFGLVSQPALASDGIDGKKLFSKKCKMCHKLDKKTAGPGVKQMRNNRDEIIGIITNGSPTKKMMKAWGGKFSGEEIEALADYILHVQSEG